jgi:hypothetical protein
MLQSNRLWAKGVVLLAQLHPKPAEMQAAFQQVFVTGKIKQ